MDVAKLLSAPGDASRGKELFFAATLNYKNCHRIGVQGGLVGPELTQIGKKYNRAQILENIVDPSKTIEPKYVTYLVQTSDGQSLSGVLVEKSDAAVTLRDAQDKLHSIPAAEVERLLPQPRSLMPEQLLRDLTAGQAADLPEYLCSLK